jgi:Uma2 family endonuclease
VSTTETKLTTADELFEMPKDGFRYELIEGELRRMSPAGDEHGGITMELAGALHQHVKRNNLGKVYAAETGFTIKIDPDTVRAPDIAFVRMERIRKTPKVKSYRMGAPDLAVEVTSPGDTVREVERKVTEWLKAGALAVWIVSPKLKTVTVYRSLTDINVLTEKDMLDGGEVVPGFQISVAEIFAL